MKSFITPHSLLCELFLYSLEIATIAGVNLDEVALVDKQRHADFHACLKSGRLCGVCCSIALYTWHAESNTELGHYSHFSKEECYVS